MLKSQTEKRGGLSVVRMGRAALLAAAFMLTLAASSAWGANGRPEKAQEANKPVSGESGETQRLRRELEAGRELIGRLSARLPEESGPASASEESLRAEITQLRALLEKSLKAVESLSSRVEALEKGASDSHPEVAQKGGSANDEEQDQRLKELEEQMTDMEERVGSRALVNVFDGESLDIGGFITQSFTAAKGEDSSEASFNHTQFELLLRAQLNRDWSFFTALGFLREADLDFSNPRRPFFRPFENRVTNIIGWANWQHSDQFQLQFGRFVTPHGIINIEHFPPVLLETNQPQFLRPFSGASIFPNFTNGIQLHGSLFYGNNTLRYNAYAGVFAGGEADDTVLGSRLAYNLYEPGLTFGFNYHYGKRQAAQSELAHFSIVGSESLTSNDYQVLGGDFLFDKGRWLWKNEAYYSFEKGGFPDRVAAYTQPAFRINDKLVLFYRYDYFDPGQGLTDSVEQVFGLNVLPRPTIRIRAAYFFKDFELLAEEEDAHILQLSATFSF